MKDQDLTVSVWAEHDDSGRWGLSVLCQANLTASQLVNVKPLRHRVFRVSTEDPHDFLATHLLHAAGSLTGSSLQFGAAYLLLHGVVKIVLVSALLRDKIW